MDGNISGPDDTEWHFWLARSMARAMEINLTRALADGRLNADQYAELIARCRNCRDPAFCERWLARQTARPAAAPGHCAIAAGLARLR